MGKSQIIEQLLYTSVVLPIASETNATLYNGGASGTGGIDTMNYDNINFLLQTGTFIGNETLDAVVIAADTDDDTAASAISGATFVQVTTSNDNTVFEGQIRCADQPRYMWLRTKQTGTGSAVFAAIAVRGKGREDPQTNSETFNV